MNQYTHGLQHKYRKVDAQGDVLTKKLFQKIQLVQNLAKGSMAALTVGIFTQKKYHLSDIIILKNQQNR